MTTEDVSQSPFLRACRGEETPRTPVWFMRQAGRSLPEYRALRADTPMLTACRTPDMIREITMQPVRRHGVDAAIFFSDIVVPLAAVGVDVDIVAGTGPVVGQPIRDMAGVEALRDLTPEDVPYITEAVGMLREELGATPLIGFAGAPFTLASYLVEGGPSRTYAKTKALMHGAPDVWHALCGRLAGITASFLKVQIDAGANAVQLFDSWAGALSAADYGMFVAPHSAAVLSAVARPGVPRIHFGVGAGHLLAAMGEVGADVVGVDWRIPLTEAAGLVGDRALQGNLDPTTLFAPEDVLAHEVRRVLAEGKAAKGHIFNLGHGVLPETDADALTKTVEYVHRFSAR
ncbi:uroporphyrinogen decarboxylase [Stackebrandtia nassauensis]|uniref:Uroporphyrinogen decarboxylase n=1 Tax=Stackebrandtia nassauensis (strain DSM 44728 / CIP 108903 / NRRL B-16338 / NBRC 102104 / LLR-40K-21) TaxID=446470 RepID=D3PZP7_STANL|nr:uroporphyrinogen decarboxylase [Stackebrandtia nassauensis]ADD43584.1 uroporphyrinogen decarboxylase [Stackebrandtia nassauensis DSM 44728]